MAAKASTLTEKEFYLRSFRHSSMLVHLADGVSARSVAPVVDELVENHTAVVVVGAAARGGAASAAADRRLLVTERLLRDGRARIARRRGLTAARAIDDSAKLAIELGVAKLVVVDPRGAILGGRGPRSFVTRATLRRLLKDRRAVAPYGVAEVRSIMAAIQGGVRTVNLTTAGDLDRELFCYEGAGTLVSGGRYCTVRPLGVNDLEEANRMIERGEREGFLAPRDARERAAVLVAGYGAWFPGASLAGIAGLETDRYRRQRVGEIVALYTITRFLGRGVGVRMVQHLLGVARERGLRAVFACTSNDRAAAFFARSGFRAAGAGEIPESKWRGRPGARPRGFWHPL